MEVEDVLGATMDIDPVPMERRLRAIAGAFASLDVIRVFELRARILRFVAVVLREGRSEQ